MFMVQEFRWEVKFYFRRKKVLFGSYKINIVDGKSFVIYGPKLYDSYNIYNRGN